MKEIIVNCPLCTRILLRHGEVKTVGDEFSFTTKCPFCQEMVKITIGVKVLALPYIGMV